MVRLDKLFHASPLTNSQDPDVWIMNQEELKEKVQPQMTINQFLLHLMMNLPTEYDDVLPILELQLTSRNKPLTLVSLRQILCDKFDRIKNNSKKLALVSKE